MIGVFRYGNYKEGSSSKNPLSTKEEWFVVLPSVLRQRFRCVICDEFFSRSYNTLLTFGLDVNVLILLL